MSEKKISFDEIMDYHADNRSVFNSIVQNINSIVHFIGAGLSAFAYPQWRKFLEDSFEKLRWTEKNECFKKMLDKYQFEKAASFLKKERGAVPFINDIKEAFSTDKIDAEDISKGLHKQAIYLLPMLFKGLVITTNFYRVLEEGYIIKRE